MREIDELEGSNTKRLVGALIGFALVAVAIGLLFRSKGTGEPEQDHRIIIIEDQIAGFEHYAAELGFDALSGSLEAWQAQVAKAGEHEAGEVGLAEILAFADLHGHGYVVIENPQRFADELAALELAEPLALGDSRFATLSVGDFADPHQLSVEPPLPGVELGVGPRMLRCLFAQPRLSQTLDPKAPASDIQTARVKLDKAIEAIAAFARHEQRAAAVREQLRAELSTFAIPGHDDDAHRARALHEPLAGASLFPLRDGRVVMRSDGLEFTVPRDSLELVASRSFSISVLPADAAASAEAVVACPELLGGGGPRGSIRRIVASPERDALFAIARDDRGTLFGFDPTAGPCGLRELGSLSLPDLDETYVAVSSRAVATREVDDLGVLQLDAHAVVAGQPSASITVSSHAFRSASSLLWLDDRHLANLTDIGDERQPALVIVSLDHPELALVLPLQPPVPTGVTADDDDTPLGYELARIPGPAPALLLRWALGDSFSLTRLDFELPGDLPLDLPREWAWDQLWPASLDDGEQPLPGPELITWTPVVTVDSHMRGFEIDPQARAVAFTHEGDLGVDVGLVALPAAGGPPSALQVILDDVYEHREVAFRPGHDELLFRTRVRLERPEASLLVAHAIATPLPGNPTPAPE